jgi:hypothetical protein
MVIVFFSILVECQIAQIPGKNLGTARFQMDAHKRGQTVIMLCQNVDRLALLSDVPRASRTRIRSAFPLDLQSC